MLGTAEVVRTNSLATFSYGHLHMNTSVLANQQSSLFVHWMYLRGPARSDDKSRRMVRKYQRTPNHQHLIMMMITHAAGWELSKKWCPLYDTELHMMVRLPIWRVWSKSSLFSSDRANHNVQGNVVQSIIVISQCINKETNFIKKSSSFSFYVNKLVLV